MRQRLTAFLLLVICQLALSRNPRTLDEIISQAKNLDDFLSRPELIEAYYLALKEKYGPDFERKSFDAILFQLNQIKDKVPGLKKRLWESGPGEAFSITQHIQTRGREINPATWQTYYRDLVNKIQKESGLLSRAYEPKDRLAKARGILLERQKIILAFEKKYPATEKNEATRKKRANFYNNLSGDKTLRAAIAQCVQEALASEQIRGQLSSGDADQILDTLMGLRTNAHLQIPGMEGMGKHFSFVVRDLLPSQESLFQEKGLFKIIEGLQPGHQTVEATYHFRPVSRIFHGIWKGIVLDECVGGRCDMLESLTPERWLSSALKGAELYEVEKYIGEADTVSQSGSYRGFIEHVPVKDPKTNEIYGSTDFGSSSLKDVIVSELKKNHRQANSLFSLWLKEKSKHLNPKWKGLIVSDSNYFDNAGMLKSIHSSQAYQQGALVPNRMAHVDPMAKAIVKAYRQPPDAITGYSGNMIVDATTPGEKTLKLLDPTFDEPSTPLPSLRYSLFREMPERGRSEFLQGNQLLFVMPAFLGGTYLLGAKFLGQSAIGQIIAFSPPLEAFSWIGLAAGSGTLAYASYHQLNYFKQFLFPRVRLALELWNQRQKERKLFPELMQPSPKCFSVLKRLNP